MSVSPSINCKRCGDPITKANNLATGTESGVSAYHYECYKEVRQERYEDRKAQGKKARLKINPVNGDAHASMLWKIFLFLWIPLLLILIIPGGVEFFANLNCELSSSRRKCGNLDGASLMGIKFVTILLWLLFTWPFVQRWLSWFLYERHLTD
jgi:hypothetical protein